MTLVRACPIDQFDRETGTCAHEVWIDQPALLPPLSAVDGLQVSAVMVTVIASAWALKLVRRFIWQRS